MVREGRRSKPTTLPADFESTFPRSSGQGAGERLGRPITTTGGGQTPRSASWHRIPGHAGADAPTQTSHLQLVEDRATAWGRSLMCMDRFEGYLVRGICASDE